ncbi:MAG TPA: hypothetical protein PKE56_07700, partial [Acidimicrobiales bacterium]|nr:hypothetical protein [Acidimicrobiales bacterium]
MTDLDLHLLDTGRPLALHDRLGAHLTGEPGEAGVQFSVWAPAATAVSVVGDWNHWTVGSDPLHRSGGVWQGDVAPPGEGPRHKVAG